MCSCGPSTLNKNIENKQKDRQMIDKPSAIFYLVSKQNVRRKFELTD